MPVIISQPDSGIHKDGTTTTIAEIPFAAGLSSDADVNMTQAGALIHFNSGGGDAGIFDDATGAGFYPQAASSSGSLLDCKNKCRIDVDGTTVMLFTSTAVQFSPPASFDDTIYCTKRITAQAGTGGSTIGVGGTLSNSITQTGSSTGGAVDLWAYSVPGSTLDTNLDSLTFDVCFSAANTVNNKQVTVTFAGTTIYNTNNIGAQNGDMHLRGVITRVNSTTCYCVVHGYTNTKWVSRATYTSVTATLSSNQNFKITAAAATANNDVVFRLGKLNWEPVP